MIDRARAARVTIPGQRDGVIITEMPKRYRVRILVGKRRYRSRFFATITAAEHYARGWTTNNSTLTA